MGRQIGYGEKTNIWNDAWVPLPRKQRFVSQTIDLNYTKVADLIIAEDFSWKQEVVRNLLDNNQAEAVLSIPLVNKLHPDARVWYGDSLEIIQLKVATNG